MVEVNMREMRRKGLDEKETKNKKRKKRTNKAGK